MVLPGLRIPISLEDFETIFEYFINEYILSGDNPYLQFDKCKIGSSGHRYTINCKRKDSLQSNPVKIGEIDVFKIFEERVEIKAAAYDIENSKDGLRFFDDFYTMVFNRWQIAPNSFHGHPIDDSVATNLYIKIGIETGYLRLPGVITEMPKPKGNYWYINDKKTVSVQSNDFYLTVSDVERKKIIQTYNNEINKGLPEKFEVSKLPTEKLTAGLHEKTYARAELIKKIKDKHPGWSQSRVASEFNKMHYDNDSFITKTEVQNAYRAMGWTWKRADREDNFYES